MTALPVKVEPPGWLEKSVVNNVFPPGPCGFVMVIVPFAKQVGLVELTVPEMAVSTVTVEEAVALQLLALVTVTEYVPDVLNVLLAEEGVEPPDHRYDVPPEAVRLTVPHEVVVPDMLATGKALTITGVAVEVAEQPVLVTVTV